MQVLKVNFFASLIFFDLNHGNGGCNRKANTIMINKFFVTSKLLTKESVRK
jgi:hypothetical protein